MRYFFSWGYILHIVKIDVECIHIARLNGSPPFNSSNVKKVLKLNKKCKIEYECKEFEGVSTNCNFPFPYFNSPRYESTKTNA